jgi:hypothetical protein
MKIFTNHYGNRKTVIVAGYCMNGCEVFNASRARAVFRKHKVSEEHQRDVMTHLVASANDTLEQQAEALTHASLETCFIPKHLQTEALFALAVKNYKLPLKYVPDDIRGEQHDTCQH